MKKCLLLVLSVSFLSMGTASADKPSGLLELIGLNSSPDGANTVRIPTTAVLVVSSSQILVDGEEVVTLDQDGTVAEEFKRGTMITPLYDHLQEKIDQFKALVPGLPVDGVLVIDAGPAIPFSLLREVMYTAGQAQYGVHQFVVQREGQGSVIEVSLPTIGEAKVDSENTGKPLMLTIAIVEGGFIVGGNAVALAVGDQAEEPRKPTIPTDAQKNQQFAALSELLVQVKKEFPQETVAIVIPAANTSYATIMETLQATSSHTPDGTDAPMTLFPTQIIAGGAQEPGS